MQSIFHDDFNVHGEKEYPYNWVVERTCEHPDNLGWVDQAGLALLYEGNKHIPLAPSLKDFELNIVCHADRLFSPMELLVYFRYDRKKQAGYCLKYRWGVCGGITHASQKKLP